MRVRVIKCEFCTEGSSEGSLNSQMSNFLSIQAIEESQQCLKLCR